MPYPSHPRPDYLIILGEEYMLRSSSIGWFSFLKHSLCSSITVRDHWRRVQVTKLLDRMVFFPQTQPMFLHYCQRPLAKSTGYEAPR
jgi:hypothetical protein